MRRRELARALRKIRGLSKEDSKTLDAMTRSIINRLLHDPTISLKRNSGDEYLRAVREMFLLGDDAE